MVSSKIQSTTAPRKHYSVKQVDPSRTSRIRSFILGLGPELDNEILAQHFEGEGTAAEPYIVDFLHHDRQDALDLPETRKRSIAALQSCSTLAVTFASSVYAGGLPSPQRELHVSSDVGTLGLALFVLGFAVKLLIWAPLSELYGRRSVYLVSYTCYVLLCLGTIFSPNIAAVLLLRFCASSYGASVLATSSAIAMDVVSNRDRGVATALFAAMPMVGPCLGPIAGGFLGEKAAWRWILVLIRALSGVVWFANVLFVREAYAPFIRRARANALHLLTENIYVARIDQGRPPETLCKKLSVSLSRPWALLCREPIILLATIYMSIMYGTLYALFGAVPIVFQGGRGWSQGVAGLSFLGVLGGVIIDLVVCGNDNTNYVKMLKISSEQGRVVEPEVRLRLAMLGAIAAPCGLFLFAFTTFPSVQWLMPIIGASLSAFGFVTVFISLLSYLTGSYVIYVASVMAATSAVQSVFGMVFPLFTDQMYHNLGDAWASSIPAFLALACLPFPRVLRKYGHRIRAKCRCTAEAARVLELLHARRFLGCALRISLEKSRARGGS